MKDKQREEYRKKCQHWSRGNRCVKWDYFEGRVRHRKTIKCNDDCWYMRDYDKEHNLFDLSEVENKKKQKEDEPQMNFIDFLKQENNLN